MNRIETIIQEIEKTKLAKEASEKKISEIEKPFERKIVKIENEMNSATSEECENRDQLEKKLGILHNQLQEAKKEEQQNLWKDKLPTNFESFKSWLEVHKKTTMKNKTIDCDLYSPEEIRPSKLKNDITILGLKVWGEKVYIATKNNKLVGKLFIEMPRHPGDWTNAEGYVLTRKGNEFREVELREKYDYGSWGNVKKPFGTWKDALIKLK